MKFTERSVMALQPKKERYEVWEDNRRGFGLRIGPTKKTWIFLYRYQGKARRMILGVFPKDSLAEAHAAHSEAVLKLEEGIDPGTERVQGKVSERNAETVADLVEVYLEKWARPRKRASSVKEDERMLRKDVIPVWGHRKACDIRRKDVIALMDDLLARGATVTANRTLAVIRKMFNFALSRDIIDATPCAQIAAPAKENRRDRVLSEEEIRAFWTGLSKAGMSEGVKLALKLQLVTAQRKGEVSTAEWKDFDLDNRMWVIPGEKTKNGFPHRVPLSHLAMNILEEMRIQSQNSRWLFPSPRTLEKPMIPTSFDHALKRHIAKLGVGESFCPHDLRRTAGTQMTSMGISRLAVGKILNHTERSVTAIYDRHGYDDEKRMALDTWGRKLEAIISGSVNGKVIPLIRKEVNG